MPAIKGLSLALVLLIAALIPAKADERILRFVSDIAVQRNGDLLVTETIRVRAEGNVIKRGILRDFPTVYTRSDGTRVEVAFDVQSVSRDGSAENFTSERMANGWRVRIGRADTMLRNGIYEYRIHYRTTRQVGFFKDFDELYWNVTGNGWTFPIDEAEASISLPEAVPFLQNAFYTGAFGAKDKDAQVVEQIPGRIVFRTTKPMPTGHGLTVAAGWQKGVITQPTGTELKGLWLRDNLPIVLAVAVLVLMVGYYVYAWWAVGRDPRAGTIIPLFTPPAGMSAAAVRFVWRMDVDDKTFTAALIDTAVRGHFKLSEKKTLGMKLVPREGGQPLAAAEAAMEQKLFGKRSSPIELDQQNYSILQRAQSELFAWLRKAYQDTLFHSNKAWSVRGILVALGLSALVLVSVFAAWGSDEGAGMLVAAASLVPAMIVATLLTTFGPPRSIGTIVLCVFGCVFSLLVGASGYSVVNSLSQGWIHALPAALPAILVPIASSAFSWMKAHTPEGRRITDQIEGFRQYLGVAERDRLNALNPPQETAELFEKYLPYAIALDVENAWAKRFEGVLAAMAISPDSGDTWYTGSRDWRNDPVSFSSYLGGALSHTISAAATPPGSTDSGSSGSSSSSSSGSDGGGSSGGGGGGGGGSGW